MTCAITNLIDLQGHFNYFCLEISVAYFSGARFSKNLKKFFKKS